MVALLDMQGIVKCYGTVRANRAVDLTVESGRVVGLLGENGSGKSTLMKVLFGMVRPDAGRIHVAGAPLVGHSPRDAIAAGIGMIHQHFTLVDAMTVTENVMLGWQDAGSILKPVAMAAQIRQASATFGLAVDPDAVVATLSFGARQRVEIVKAILRGARLLILDEPTSNLSPPEVAGLLSVIRRLRENGRAVIFISHKLAEVIEICDEVVVLRDGAVSGRAFVADVTRESLARMMVERDLSAPVTRATTAPGDVTLSVQKLSRAEGSGVARLDNVSFEVRAGEILAVAGVDGNGQADLLDTLAGILPASGGRILLCGRDISILGARQRLAAGVAYIPVDRGGTSLVPGMTIADNLVMRDFDRAPLSRGPLLSYGAIARRAVERMAAFDIRAAGANAPARTLSGGNQQKIVLAREIGRQPRLLLAFQPTWGLDPGAARFVIEQLLALRDAGGAILYVSAELEEVLTLGDRIAVMCNGRLSEPMTRAAVDVTRIGLMMAGAA
ncbi:ABC transporter ATP-binding protein [Bradyrhizobium prioriisuperbiae]|uniref:ABC transporter ATP-binding protein n=1 Tax=Bradyrhizobium prioriisuperbiae TaxID=2854389 RepID=UPI0028EC3AB1|nr:ABC transporter ATP-binding protein [Bradyrhizobium prioritasuperba]